MSENAAPFPSGRLVVALLVLSIALWAVLSFVTVPHLQQLAGGLPPFDARLRGYGYEEARALLLALGVEGRAYYLSPELVLDAIFPPLYAAFGVLALWWLTMPGRLRDGAVPMALRVTLVAFPVAGACLRRRGERLHREDDLEVARSFARPRERCKSRYAVEVRCCSADTNFPGCARRGCRGAGDFAPAKETAGLKKLERRNGALTHPTSSRPATDRT